MLVLSRKPGERVKISDDPAIWVTVVDAKGDTIRLGFDAPRDVLILREEIADDDAKPAS